MTYQDGKIDLIYHTTVEGRISMKEFRIKEKKRKDPPTSYTLNNDEEKLCLEIINGFRQRFSSNYRFGNMDVSKLFLTALNEFHVEKCVCSTIRPQFFPYPEIHDVFTCCKFVADFFNFEPLKDPRVVPRFLPSPSQTIEWTIGDCFDLAIVLSSFLIGAGYDAYVVHGMAHEWICRKDTGITSYNEDKTNQYNGFNVWKDIKGERERKSKDQTYPKTENNLTQTDTSLMSRRKSEQTYIHCWVLVKPGLRQDLKSTFFVEPSTGQIISSNNGNVNSPFTEIFAIWNTKNYWINRYVDKGIPVFDSLQDVNRWLPVFHNSHSTSHQADTLNIQHRPGVPTTPFDPPISWVESLHIDSELYGFRYPPNGHRVARYKDSKVELYSNKLNEEGVVRRVTKYSDSDHIGVDQCTEYFVNDHVHCLVRRIRRPTEMSIREFFSKKQKYALEQLNEIIGIEREMKFRLKNRKDGLVYRKEIFGRNRIVEHYSDRPDRLLKRLIDLSTTVNENEKSVLHLTENDNTKKMAITRIEDLYSVGSKTHTPQVIKRVYLLEDCKIVTTYQTYEEGYNTTQDSILNKDDLSFEVEECSCANEAVQELLTIEKEVFLSVEKQHNEMLETIIHTREREEGVRFGEISKSNNMHFDALSKNLSHQNSEEANTVQDGTKDYLSAYMTFVEDPSNISAEEGQQIIQAYLKAGKDRILERANIIQNRLYEETEKLSKLQASYQRGNKDLCLDDFEKECCEINFRIKVLGLRLLEHEEKSVEKYKALERKLFDDPRFKCLQES